MRSMCGIEAHSPSQTYPSPRIPSRSAAFLPWLSTPFLPRLRITFRTQQLATYAPPKQVEVTKHLGDEGVDATDKVVTVSLTQADTLLLGSLSPDEDQQVEVQIRGRTEDGRAFASNIMTAPLSRILKDGVI